jgi:type I restriction enzyme S subunit
MTWQSARLGEVAVVERRGVDPTLLPAETRYLGLEHIERGGRITGCPTVGDAAVTSTKFAFDSQHILLGRLRPNLGKVARPLFDGVCSTDILPIRPGNQLDRAYLHHYLMQPCVVELATALATGANLPRLNTSVLERFEIPLPPLDEQQRIATILDQADTLRAKRCQALAHLMKLQQAIFLEMFGDPAANAFRWEFAALNDISTVAGEYGANVPSIEYDPELPRYVRITDVTDYGKLTLEPRSPGGDRGGWQRYELREGDLLFARSGATVGKTYLHTESNGPCVFAGYLIRFRPNQEVVQPRFLFAFTKTSAYATWVRGHQNVVAQQRAPGTGPPTGATAGVRSPAQFGGAGLITDG